jgi:hypothetical protein
MSARTRTCLGCEGTGRDEAERRRQHIEHSRKFGWAGIPRYMVPALPMAPPCPACLGSGTVTEPDSRKDAMADADTLRSIYRQHHKARGYSRTLVAKAGAGGDYIIQARPWLGTDGKDVGRRAAQLAFRAVPALKGESL